MTLIFYTNPQSRGRIVHWMLEETGVPYETRAVAFGPEMKAPGYRAINPMGKVPALVHDGSVLTEAAAICVYLADRFPDKGLMPPAADPARAAFFRWSFFAAGPLEQAVTAKALGWQVPEGKGSMVGFGMRFNTIEARPVFTDYWGRISARPALARSTALNDALLPKG